MDTSLLFAVGGGLFFVAIFLSGYALLVSRPNIEERVTGVARSKEPFDWSVYLKRSEKILKPLGEMIPRSPEEMSRQERRLAQAGIRRKDGPMLLHGVKLALAIILILTATATGYWRENPILFVVLPILFGALIPDMWLTRAIQSRKDRLRMALPDALDLAIVCAEAGLGLDQSLVRIGQELRDVYPELSDEFNLYSLEVNAGKKRADALRNLGQRTDVDDIRAFVAVLIQTDRFGTSVAQSLRVFAETMRTKRRQRAEEHAAKMNIKMIPPLVFFVFPAIFVVVLGPAIVAIVRYLVPGLTGSP